MIPLQYITPSDLVVQSHHPSLHLTYLTSKTTHKEFILRKLQGIHTHTSWEPLMIPHPHVAHLIEYRYQKQPPSTHLLFEAPFLTLEALRQERGYTKSYFTEGQLLTMLYQIVQGLTHIRNVWGWHRAIKSSNFGVDGNSNIKVNYPMTKTLVNNLQRVKAMMGNHTGQIYLSPQEIAVLGNRKEVRQELVGKSDVFSLGMVVLELGLLRTLEDVYSTPGTIDVNILNRSISEFQKRYGFVGGIVKQLLVLQHQTRSDLKSLESQLQGVYAKEYSYKSHSTNSDVYPFALRTGGSKTYENTVYFQGQDRYQIRLSGESEAQKQTREKTVSMERDGERMSRSPCSRKQELIYETTSLSSAIKEKLNKLLDVSHNLKTYEYSSKSREKMNREKHSQGIYPQNEAFNHRRKTTINTEPHTSANSKFTHLSTMARYQQQQQSIFEIESQDTSIAIEQNDLFSFAQNKEKSPTEESILEAFPNVNLAELTFNKQSYQAIPSLCFNSRNDDMILDRGISQLQRRLVQTDRSSVKKLVESRYQFMNDRRQSQAHLLSVQKQQCANKNISLFSRLSSLNSSNKNLKSQSVAKQPLDVPSQCKRISNYEGQVKKGLKHGQGRFTFSDGAIYNGQWSLNKMHGHGQLFYPSGKLAYDGQWFRQKMQGFGKLYNQHPLIKKINYKNFNSSNSSWIRYQGTFKADMKHGNGTLFFSNGEQYTGEFFENMVHGEGVFSDKEIQVEGMWERGELKLKY